MTALCKLVFESCHHSMMLSFFLPRQFDNPSPSDANRVQGSTPDLLLHMMSKHWQFRCCRFRRKSKGTRHFADERTGRKMLNRNIECHSYQSLLFCVVSPVVEDVFRRRKRLPWILEWVVAAEARWRKEVRRPTRGRCNAGSSLNEGENDGNHRFKRSFLAIR